VKVFIFKFITILEDINEIKKKLNTQDIALKEYENWLNILLNVIHKSENNLYAVKVKNVKKKNYL
jgi:hypothetical protein